MSTRYSLLSLPRVPMVQSLEIHDSSWERHASSQCLQQREQALQSESEIVTKHSIQ
eukprot:m.100851 g.100851  ORF g.100851 m.100851 type:complete len:56 (-) comp13726_c0_seq2:2625-2792(-)